MTGHRTGGDARSLAAGACARLKVFPLQGVVVFPGTPTPFHVFEPRYRELVADALASDGVLAVPTLAAPGEDVLRPEAVRPIAGACVIEDHQKLPDGRFHILVRGLARVRLGRELPSGRAYRAFRAEVLEDVVAPGGDDALESKREGLEQLLVQIAAGLPAESGAPRLAADAARLGPSALADLAAAALVTDGDARYAILAELDVGRRLDLVLAEAAAVVLAIGGAGGAQA
jgi:Lon protease-like protein